MTTFWIGGSRRGANSGMPSDAASILWSLSLLGLFGSRGMHECSTDHNNSKAPRNCCAKSQRRFRT